MFICYVSTCSYVTCPHVHMLRVHMFICYVSTCSCRTPVHMITSLQAHMFIRARVHNYIRVHMITGHMITYTLDHPMFTRSLVHTCSIHMLACSLDHSPMRSYGMYTWYRMLIYTYAHVYTLIHTVTWSHARMYVCLLIISSRDHRYTYAHVYTLIHTVTWSPARMYICLLIICSRDYRYTCALVRHVYIWTFHMFPTLFQNTKGG